MKDCLDRPEGLSRSRLSLIWSGSVSVSFIELSSEKSTRGCALFCVTTGLSPQEGPELNGYS